MRVRSCVGVIILLAVFISLPASARSQNVLASGECMSPNETRTSASGQFVLYYQSDGNLVLYNTWSGWTPVWWTGTTWSSAGTTCMQGDGNLVVYDANWVAMWPSGTAGNGGAFLEVHDGGAIVIRRPDGSAILGEPFTPSEAPQGQRRVFLVNGSFSPNAEWMQPGAPEYSAIQATYGVWPEPYSWPGTGVSPTEGYEGILGAAFQFTNLLLALPQQDKVTVVAHSHGGNVALLAATLLPSGRSIHNLVNLGTPVNWDLREAMSPKAAYLCQVSSTADWVQVVGSSPRQLAGLLGSAYLANHYYQLANDYFLVGNYEMSAYYMGLAMAGTAVGQWYVNSTREEWWGATVGVAGVSHSGLHEPSVWQWGIPNACKLQ